MHESNFQTITTHQLYTDIFENERYLSTLPVSLKVDPLDHMDDMMLEIGITISSFGKTQAKQLRINFDQSTYLKIDEKGEAKYYFRNSAGPYHTKCLCIKLHTDYWKKD